MQTLPRPILPDDAGLLAAAAHLCLTVEGAGPASPAHMADNRGIGGRCDVTTGAGRGRRVRTGVAYFGNRTPRHVEADMRDIAASGFDYVVHCLTESDLLDAVETMRRIVAISHEAGLEVHVSP